MTSLYARHKRTTLAIATAVAAGALVTTGLTAGTAAAQTPAETGGKSVQPAAPVQLSAAARTTLIKQQQADAPETAQAIGLGAKEKLVVKDVVKDADGTVHTRYERTYAGLPVLGGDLVVHTRHRRVQGRDQGEHGDHQGGHADPEGRHGQGREAGADRRQGRRLRARPRRTRPPARSIWAGHGTPVLAYETVVGGFQDDGTPSQLHVITDAATGKKLFEYQGIETGTGKSLYSGTVTPRHHQVGLDVQPDRRHPRRPQDVQPEAHGTASGTGTLFTDADDIWGTGAASSSTTDETAAVDAAYGAQETWDFYKTTFGRSGIKNNGVAAYSRVHYGNAYVNAFWDDSCFCMTYGDGDGNNHPLTSLDVAGHEMSHGVTSNTAGLNYSGESGGLNEATSDIFGTGVEFYANNASDQGDYLIGEKIDINGDGTPAALHGQAQQGRRLRRLLVLRRRQPRRALLVRRRQPLLLPAVARAAARRRSTACRYNSPTSNGSTVTGIGRDKALQIWYKALTTYLTSTTNYKRRARTGDAERRRRTCTAPTSAEYKAVAAAWSAVNVS